MNFPILPRPDTVGAVVPESLPHDRGRTSPVDLGVVRGGGVYLLATLAAGFAAIPIFAVLGETSVNGAIGPTEIWRRSPATS